jgi:hypothetical protein
VIFECSDREVHAGKINAGGSHGCAREVDHLGIWIDRIDRETRFE